MNETPAEILSEFVKRVKDANVRVNAARGKEAEKLNAELSLFIAQQVQRLMKHGLTVTEIQNTLRAEIDTVPQTYAPDRESPEDTTGEKLKPPIGETRYFFPVADSVIAAFAAGKLSKKDLMEKICSSEEMAAIEMSEGLDLVLTDFGKKPAMDTVSGGGEIVAGDDGEAFMPEYLDICDEDDYRFLVCEPMVFKAAEETGNIYESLKTFTEKKFMKSANIKKLIKAGWLAEYDAGSIKREASFIKQELWKEYAKLLTVYRKAAEAKNGIVIFSGYEGEPSVAE